MISVLAVLSLSPPFVLAARVRVFKTPVVWAPPAAARPVWHSPTPARLVWSRQA